MSVTGESILPSPSPSLPSWRDVAAKIWSFWDPRETQACPTKSFIVTKPNPAPKWPKHSLAKAIQSVEQKQAQLPPSGISKGEWIIVINEHQVTAGVVCNLSAVALWSVTLLRGFVQFLCP